MQYLRAHHIQIGKRPVVIQRGFQNYAGPSCPGIGWTCTTSMGKVVVQFATNSAGNQFQCTATPSGTVTDPDSNTCTIVQMSSGANNSATCVEQTSVSSGLVQGCDIKQVNTTGNNQAVVQQAVVARSGSAQDATQSANVFQQAGSGNNSASVTQSVNQATGSTGSGGTQSQDAHQTAAVKQVSDTGNNQAAINESEGQQEQIPTAVGTKGPMQPVNETQNTSCPTAPCPNENAAVYQSSSLTAGGANTATIAQSLAQKAGAPGNNVSGSQTQGSPDGGLNGHFDQQSSGVSTANGSQSEQQSLSPTTGHTPLVQTQYDPAWMGSPQGTNPSDQYNINQNINQQGSNNADQTIEIFTNCDTTGTCTGHETETQNGSTSSQSCPGTPCHLAVDCTSGGESPGCFPSNCDGEPCETPPAPPPPPVGLGPTITSVTFSNGYDACCAGSGPTVTVNGSGFGASASQPTGLASSGAPGCSALGDDGSDYGTAFSYSGTHTDTVVFTAGQGSPPSSGSCVGLKITTWTDTQVVYTFGSAYDAPNGGEWYLTNGDSFTQHLEGASFTGAVSGLPPFIIP
jgi:hypothetical protein